jgi:hypothetical protein
VNERDGKGDRVGKRVVKGRENNRSRERGGRDGAGSKVEGSDRNVYVCSLHSEYVHSAEIR